MLLNFLNLINLEKCETRGCTARSNDLSALMQRCAASWSQFVDNAEKRERVNVRTCWVLIGQLKGGEMNDKHEGGDVNHRKIIYKQSVH